MSLFFSGAVTSSPIKRRLRSNHCHSLDASFLSPDSSYYCYSSEDNSAPCCCRRSPRLLTNGYYDVTEESFCRDHEGNVSLTPCKTNVSYKENPVRIFRRRRKPRNPLARLFSDVTESCQTWLDEKIFRGMFGTSVHQNEELNPDPDHDPGCDRACGGCCSQEGAAASPLDQSWSALSCSGGGAEVEVGFKYDPTEAPPNPDKVPPPQTLLSPEVVCPEVGGRSSDQGFTQTLGGLSEVPPPPVYFPAPCSSPERRGPTLKNFLLLIFTIFITTALFSRCLWWSSSITCSAFVAMTTFMLVTKTGPMGEWRRAKTEDITSRNE